LQALNVHNAKANATVKPLQSGSHKSPKTHWGHDMNRFVKRYFYRLFTALTLLSLVACAQAAFRVDKRDRPVIVKSSPTSKAAPKPTQALRRVAPLLLGSNVLNQKSYLACIQDRMHQGFAPIKAMDDCAIKLAQDLKREQAGQPLASFGAAAERFDPQSVVSACGGGGSDPTKSQGWADVPTQVPWTTVQPNRFINTPEGRLSEYGSFSFGGESKTLMTSKGEPYATGDPSGRSQPYRYAGLSYEEAVKIKAEWVKEAEDAKAAWQAAESASKADPNNAAKKDKVDAAYKKYQTASEKAGNDPNLVPYTSVRTAGDQSVCNGVMDSVREMLRECNRNQWTSASCQTLHARMNACADPTKIVVDPDAGYVCAPSVSPAAVAAAAQARCEQITTPGPNGGTPCKPGNVSDNGTYLSGGRQDICNDPLAFVDADSGVCIRTLSALDTGQKSIQSLIQYALGHFGGPTIVLPSGNPPPPQTGPKPEPKPK
jgi:hypothetical protein